MNNDIVISLQHLSKAYDGKQVLDDISLDIRYALFVIDRIGGAGHLIDEMTIETE